ncbi:MAG: stage II sporulation protein D [Oscillospiraceae bacterium]
MKRVVAAAAGLVLILFLLPILLVEGPAGTKAEETPLVLPATPTPARAQGETGTEKDAQTTVRVAMEGGEVAEMTMEDYLWSVVAAEMPASFEVEALKAQAVTARTYTTWKMAAGEQNHPEADVCTDINCCQAFLSREQAAANWGASAAEYIEKISAAVAATDGQIMTYEGQPIQAVFFSSSAGRTEDAVAVWGNSVPYLVGVDSPEGENVPNYHTEVTLTAEEFRAIFLAEYPGADLSGKPDTWFRNQTFTASGRVAAMDVGGVNVKGTQLRSLFSLRSTSFTVEAGADCVTFRVTGYGHGVGMSQYGANTLAQQGKTWEEILAWYYTGIEIG